MSDVPANDLPIGIFDSGVGGLTVLRAIHELMPAENLRYLGDTARLPYGTKSPASISRYASQAAAGLCEKPVKLLVVACNTASAVALEELTAQCAPLPVVGVVDPGASAAVATRPAGSHLVLATEATVRLGAYRRAILEKDPEANVREHACEMLVALAEEGWTRGDIADALVTRYLADACREGYRPDTVILGCTHFPLLKGTVGKALPANVTVVDSALTTAEVVRSTLRERDLLAIRTRPGDLTFLATDGAARFARVGGQFLGKPLMAKDVQLVDL